VTLDIGQRFGDVEKKNAGGGQGNRLQKKREEKGGVSARIMPLTLNKTRKSSLRERKDSLS